MDHPAPTNPFASAPLRYWLLRTTVWVPMMLVLHLIAPLPVGFALGLVLGFVVLRLHYVYAPHLTTATVRPGIIGELACLILTAAAVSILLTIARIPADVITLA